MIRWNVRVGSKTEASAGRLDVGFTPKRGHRRRSLPCPVRAMNGLMHRSKNPVTTRSASQRGTTCGEARPNSRSAFALCQQNEVMHSSNLLVMLECLQGDFIVLARSQAGRKRTKIIERMERQIHPVFRL